LNFLQGSTKIIIHQNFTSGRGREGHVLPYLRIILAGYQRKLELRNQQDMRDTAREAWRGGACTEGMLKEKLSEMVQEH